MRLLVLLATILVSLTLATPNLATAEPIGTQSMVHVPYNGFVNLQYQGFAPDSPLTVSVSANGGPYRVLDLGLSPADPSGGGSFLFTPIYAVDRGFAGSLVVRICDGSGNCLRFTMTVGTSHPVIVGHPQEQNSLCEVLVSIGSGKSVSFPTGFLLRQLGQDNLGRLAFKCGFTEGQVRFLLHAIFPD